jgi:hypothetical protein
MPTTDYLPVATSGGANVDTQANFAGSSYQLDGFVNGIALPAQANKIWRQASMMAAAIANFIVGQTGESVPDDGNLTNLVAQITEAVAPVATVSANLSGSRSFGISEGPTTAATVVSGWATLSGSSTATIVCSLGASSPTTNVWQMDYTATLAGGNGGFSFVVPKGYYYKVTATGSVTGVGGWFETELT